MSDHPKTLKDGTLEELLFWEKVYVNVVSASDCKSTETARSWATRAVLQRREVFPHIVEEEKVGSDV